MERIRNLTLYQKCILILLLLMMIVFAVIYCVLTNRVGYPYSGSILVPEQHNGTTVYEGKVEGFPTTITVTEEKTVTFRFGETTYGPYTAAEDPAAIPKAHDLAEHMTGIVIMEKDRVVFEGGVLDMEDPVLFSKDNSDAWYISSYAVMSDGTKVDSYGNPIDPVTLLEPSPRDILKLMGSPELTNKGYWGAWFFGVLFSVITAISIVFADELFAFSLSLRVNYAGSAEPSDLVIMGRNISWIVCPIMILYLYMLGLQ